MRALSLVAIGFFVTRLHAAEGMWTLDNLPTEALQTEYGFTPDEAFVARAMKASVRLAGGCSGSFVSPEGLVLTNHHCVVGCVQELSSAEEDLIQSGFVATTRSEERACPAVELNQLQAITDVTDEVREATEGLSGAAFTQARNRIRAKIESACVDGDSAQRRCDVVELYNGGRYHLYRYERYQDVRLVFAPEYASGFFGGDPDNFNFPRFNLDMALLRAYRKGKPVQTEAYFPFQAQGAAEGELAFVIGHPGATQRLRTLAQLERERDIDLREQLLYLAELRGVLLQYVSEGGEPARLASTDLTSIENGYKVLNGRLSALVDPVFFNRKREEAAALRAALAEDEDALQALESAEAAIAEAQQRYRAFHREYQLIENARGFRGDYFRLARALVRAAAEREKPDGERLRGYTEAERPQLEQRVLSSAPIDPAYEAVQLGWSLIKLREQLGPDDAFVKLVLGKAAPREVARRLTAKTQLGDLAFRKALWEGGGKAIAASSDPFIQLARAVDMPARELRKRYEDEVESVEKRHAETLANLRFQAFGTGVYPDATFTLRLSYGEVAGWEEAGRVIPPFTDFAGLYARATGADPFRLAPSWIAAKDRLPLETRFNFVSTHDIIGGNSGSPVINRAGELVGLAFDGNIHSLGGAYGYDGRMNRAVSVHAAAMVEALKTVYGAEALVKEINPRGLAAR
jgi:hypothetical protein